MSALTYGQNVRPRVLKESFTSGIEAGSSCKSLHAGPILWQQGITSIPRLKFYPSQWLSGKNTAGMLVCSEGPGFDPRPRQSMSILMLCRASPGCDTLTSQEPWHVPVTQLLGGAPLVLICSFRPNPYHHKINCIFLSSKSCISLR